MKLSNTLYLLIIPLLMSPSLTAHKDTNTASNIESIVFEDDIYNNRRCARDLRACETANRYLEKEVFVLEDELAHARQKIKRLQIELRRSEKKLSLYQNSYSPRRPQAHGYGDGYQKPRKKKKTEPRSPRKPRHY